MPQYNISNVLKIIFVFCYYQATQ